MKNAPRVLATIAILAAATSAHATPSTTFWTPATTYVQPFAVPHITYDSYVAEQAGFQNDYGLTLGFLPFEKLQGEFGIDTFLPGLQSANIYLNAKLGVPEGAYGDWFPGISAGIYNLGFKSDVNDFDILHAEIGKTFPLIGNLTVGGYYGLNDKLLVNPTTGEKQQGGFMASWTSPDINIGVTGLNKIILLADVQTGKNAVGAAGGGIGFYFTPSIDILTGPVFFFEKSATTQLPGPGIHPPGNSDWLWTVQLDVDFDLRAPKPAAPPVPVAPPKA